MCATVCPVSHWRFFESCPDLQQRSEIEHNSNCYLIGTVIKASSFPRASRRPSCLFSLRPEGRHYLYTSSSASLALPLRPSCPFRFRRCAHPASLVIQPIFVIVSARWPLPVIPNISTDPPQRWTRTASCTLTLATRNTTSTDLRLVLFHSNRTLHRNPYLHPGSEMLRMYAILSMTPSTPLNPSYD